MPGMFDALAYIHWDIDPSVFSFSDFPRWYGLSWATGLFVGYMTIRYIFKKEGRTENDIDNTTLFIIAGTILGARLGHVIFYNPQYYWEHPSEILLPFKFDPFEFIGYEGLASHGAGIGILLSAYLLSRTSTMSYLYIIDRIAILASVTGGFIRIGNLLNSEIIGKPTDVPWAFVFVSVDDLPRHPAQLYEAIFCLTLYVVLFYFWRKYRDTLPEGLLAGIFLVTVFTERFFTEFLKENQEAFEDHLWINMGQVLSIPLILIGGVLIWRGWRKGGVLHRRE